MRRASCLLLAVVCTLVPVQAAHASALIVRNAKNITLKVDRYNRALVTYTLAGTVRHTLWWGAINAKPPNPSAPHSQVRFGYDYSGGGGSFGAGYWMRMTNVCRPYTPIGLRWVVTACTMPDGSHWALQRWQRLMPNGGWPCCRTWEQGAYELHISHWNGPLPVFWLKWDWSYASLGPWDHLYGVLTYKGIGAYGFSSTPQGAPTDSFGRLVYVDTFNSAWGKGWRRVNSFLTHQISGDFCDSLFPNRFGRTNSTGKGRYYRATADGPGVLPMMYWQGPPPGHYQPGELQPTLNSRGPYARMLDDALNAEQKQIAGRTTDKCWATH
ncbi:MAG: hypothetical protein ACXVYV_09815 [Gaiellales bacterium]